MAKQKPTLPFHERILALGMVGFFLFMICLNLYLDEGKLPEKTGSPHFLKNPLIEVTVEGKIRKPGVYQVKKGTPVSELLTQAEPLPEANLKRLKLDSKILKRRKIIIR